MTFEEAVKYMSADQLMCVIATNSVVDMYKYSVASEEARHRGLFNLFERK